MALDDILSAITQETDKRITDAKDTHKKRLSSLREESERQLLRKKLEIDAQRKEKEKLMRAKAETYISLQQRNAILRKKQELLTRCYDEVKKELASLKPAGVEKLLKHFLQGIKSKGEIRPAKHHKELMEKIADEKHFTIGKPIDASGGFLFISNKEEFDFTFENLVDNYLRPKTEVQVSHSLFHS